MEKKNSKKNKFKELKVAALIVVNTVLLSALWLSFGLWSFVFSIVLIFTIGIIFTSKKNVSTPILSSLLQRQYFQVKFRILNSLDNKRSFKNTLKTNCNKIYQKVLFYLILLFKSSEEGYQIVREDVFDARGLLSKKTKSAEEKCIISALQTINKIKSKEEVGLDELESLDELLFSFYKLKQKKFVKMSASMMIFLVLATSTTSLLSTLLLPQINNIKAATYGWVQTDWSGGESTDQASHLSNQDNWTKFSSKEEKIDLSTPGEITLTSGAQKKTDTTDEDFNTWTIPSGLSVNNGELKVFECGDPVFYNNTVKSGTKQFGNTCWTLADFGYVRISDSSKCATIGAGWRPPTREEFVALSQLYPGGQHTQIRPGGSSGLNMSGYYWTSSTYFRIGTMYKYKVSVGGSSMTHTGVSSSDRYASANTRCVKSL